MYDVQVSQRKQVAVNEILFFYTTVVHWDFMLISHTE